MSATLSSKTKKFRKDLEKLSREDLLEIIKDQDIETFKQINRIEWVFQNKLNNLTWADGSTITERPLTNKELSLLIDEPFELDMDLLDFGISGEQQRQIHIAKDPCVWARQFLQAERPAIQGPQSARRNANYQHREQKQRPYLGRSRLRYYPPCAPLR